MEPHAHFMIGVPVVDGEPGELMDVCETCGLSIEEIQTPVIETKCIAKWSVSNPPPDQPIMADKIYFDEAKP